MSQNGSVNLSVYYYILAFVSASSCIYSKCLLLSYLDHANQHLMLRIIIELLRKTYSNKSIYILEKPIFTRIYTCKQIENSHNTTLLSWAQRRRIILPPALSRLYRAQKWHCAPERFINNSALRDSARQLQHLINENTSKVFKKLFKNVYNSISQAFPGETAWE